MERSKIKWIKRIKRILILFLCLMLIPVLYLLISLICTAITVNKTPDESEKTATIYLSTNGVHLDVIFEKKTMDSTLLKGIPNLERTRYLSFGWGDESFYKDTPTWGDLTFQNAFSALFLQSTTLLHVTRYQQRQVSWVPVKASVSRIIQLQKYILQTFELDEYKEKQLLPGIGYTDTDDFFKAKGSYSCFKTCNSWVNTGFKDSGLRACYWTPFDFGLLNKYTRIREKEEKAGVD
ncbi:DUF2459 domain-containing protein [Aquimarina sp. TRL1]|uniref:DUF2459 domain-containing protein n=1 Tax=Aquimarina sp. (strain TRL1) TaxID=2736252 RepID=UPI0020CB16EA|nr:DUF2459 domain-containing protein [Aquimarina sp. TRL1]